MSDAPTDMRSGLPGSGPQTLKSKLGTPSAERSMPNTSQMTPNSKSASPSSTSADTLFNHGSILSHGVSSATVGGIYSVEQLLP